MDLKSIVTSKTNIMLAITVIGAIASIVGVKLDPEQIQELTTDLTAAGDVLVILGPIGAGIYHYFSKKNAQSALMAAGVSHEDAKAATKS